MTKSELRQETATQLEAAAGQVIKMTAFIGLDGFVDEILHVVDKRESAEKYQRLPTIAQLAERLAAAAGRSTNIELVGQLTKLGGNGPIMANALASFGLKVSYLGILGYPNLHPVFADFANRAEVHSIAAKFGSADLVGFLNWTMLTYMSDIWEAVLKEVCPGMKGMRRKLFIDL